MKSVNPYLMFNGNAEEAFALYKSVFGGEPQLIRYADMGADSGMPPEAAKLVAHVALPLPNSEQLLMASDCPPGGTVEFSENPNFSVCLEPVDAAEATRVFEGLSAGGTVTMPLAGTEWAELFGMVTDRFGISWMVSFGEPQG